MGIPHQQEDYKSQKNKELFVFGYFPEVSKAIHLKSYQQDLLNVTRQMAAIDIPNWMSISSQGLIPRLRTASNTGIMRQV